VLVASFVLLAALPAKAEDWPKFRGPRADGHSAETGILQTWDRGGPEVLWRVPLGEGFSGISAVGGKLFTMFSDSQQEILAAFDADSGEELWRRTVDEHYRNQFGSGPRATPTVSDGLVFALGARGKLLVVEAETGKRVWNRDLVHSFGAKVPEWGFSGSPVVEGDLVLLDVGGAGGRLLMAFNRLDGQIAWESEAGVAGYSSPLVIDAVGVRQAIFFTGTKAVAVKVEDGATLWSVPWKTRYDVNAAMPLFVAPDHVLLSSGYGTGAMMIRLERNGDSIRTRQSWISKDFENQFSSSVLVGENLYGFDNSILRSIRASDGSSNWYARGFGHGSLFHVDGQLVVLGDKGKLSLVAATPEEFIEKATVQLLKTKSWTVPTLSEGRLFVRNEREMLALDFRASR
jgi:outer membrane protein assembly factor BamB